VQHCRLPGARWSNQRDYLARPQNQVDPVQHYEICSGLPEDALDTAQLKRRRWDFQAHS
jgi:hypothetical protein